MGKEVKKNLDETSDKNQAAPKKSNTIVNGDAGVSTQPKSLVGKDINLKILGRYQVLGELGRGGMGAVYLAEDTILKRKVALKIPQFEAAKAEQMQARFQREAQMAAQLTHPNICQVYDCGVIDGQYVMAMEFVDGKTLAAFTKPGKLLNERVVVSQIRKVAQAVEVAHMKGMIHRDLKPGNIMLCRPDPTRKSVEPKVMDFGLAKSFEAKNTELTKSGMIVGTPCYMSKEQWSARDGDLGPASDVYSLGVILYEMLTGKLPFDVHDEEPVTAWFVKLVTQSPTRPSVHNNSIDPGLEAIVMKAIAVDLKNRYASMSDFANALEDWLKGRATSGGESLVDMQLVEGPSTATSPGYDLAAPSLIKVRTPEPFATRHLGRLKKSRGGNKKNTGKYPWLKWAYFGGAILFGITLWFTMKSNRKGDTEIKAGLEITDPAVVANVNETNAQGWVSLFNGTDVSGWSSLGPFAVYNRELLASGKWGHAVSRNEYEDFELELEWRIGKNGNGGIKYRADQSGEKGTGAEFSLADDASFSPSVLTPERQTGSVWGLVAPIRLATKPVGQWNTSRIVAKGPVVEHWLNGEQLLTYDTTSPDWAKRIKDAPITNGLSQVGIRPTGHILLQSHTGEVAFRSIRIRELSSDEKVVASLNVESPIATDEVVHQGKRYKFFNEHLTWGQARDKCESLGGRLAEAHSKATNDFLLSFAKNKGSDGIWLGGSDDVKEGKWVWGDGIDFSYTNWDLSQPNNIDGKEHFLMMVVDENFKNDRAGKWWDQPDFSGLGLPQDWKMGYVCEWPITSEQGRGSQVGIRNGDFSEGFNWWKREGNADRFPIFNAGSSRAVTTHVTQKGIRGTLSQEFQVPQTADSLEFFVHGGNFPDLYIALKHNGIIKHRVHAKDTNDWSAVKWDVAAYRGQLVTLEIVDNRSDWGHIGVHSFKLTPTAPSVVPSDQASWIPLFDGSDTSRWSSLGPFLVKDGVLVANDVKGNVISRDQYEDFELEVEWRVGPKANGGIYYREQPTSEIRAGFEYNIQDDAEFLEKNGKERATGSLYGIVAPSAMVAKPVGEWNTAKIICNGLIVEHWLNGSLLLRYDTTSADFETAFGKFKGKSNMTVLERGHILLQSNGGEVAYRNIRIRELPLKTQMTSSTVIGSALNRVATIYGGDWTIEGDELVQSKITPKFNSLTFGDLEWSDYDFSFEGRILPQEKMHGFSANFHQPSHYKYYTFGLGSYYNNGHEVARWGGGKWHRDEGMYKGGSIEPDRWYSVKVEVRSNKVTCYLDGKLLFKNDSLEWTSGRCGVQAWDTAARFRNFKVVSPSGELMWEGLPDLGTAASNASTTPVLAVDGNQPEVPTDPVVDVIKNAAIPADAKTYKGHSYKFFNESLTWTQAKQRCEEMGGHLPVIDIPAENDFLVELTDEGFPKEKRTGKESVWLGFTDQEREGIWLWIDKKPHRYTNWEKNQPNNKANEEHFAVLWITTEGTSTTGVWADQPDASKQHRMGFICEWDSGHANSTLETSADNDKDPLLTVYSQAKDNAANLLLKAFDKEITLAEKLFTDKPDEKKEFVDALNLERNSFEKHGRIPFSSSMRAATINYLRVLASARKRAEEVYVRTGQVPNKDELREVVAELKVSRQNKEPVVLTLLSDGSVLKDTSNYSQIWILNTTNFIARHDSGTATPAWIDTYSIESNGQKMNGKNLSGTILEIDVLRP